MTWLSAADGRGQMLQRAVAEGGPRPVMSWGSPTDEPAEPVHAVGGHHAVSVLARVRETTVALPVSRLPGSSPTASCRSPCRGTAAQAREVRAPPGTVITPLAHRLPGARAGHRGPMGLRGEVFLTRPGRVGLRDRERFGTDGGTPTRNLLEEDSTRVA